jgi:dCTP deaminase
MSEGIKKMSHNNYEVSKNSSILSDIEIIERLVDDDGKCIFVSPIIDLTTQLGPSSLDLRLGYDLVGMRTLQKTHIDLAEKGAKISLLEKKSRYFDRQRVDPDGNFVLHPGTFLLASTLEFIRLPCDIAGRLEGRSSLGRLGLQVHATAGFVDPGFEGNLTFELINSGKLPIRVFPGLRMGQICFFYIPHVEMPYRSKTYSKYAGKLGVDFTRIEEDPEILGKGNN